MELIYSNVESNKLLHIINRLDEISGREEVVPENNFIQCATLKMEKGKTFRPHKHIEKHRTYEKQIAQESWVVIRGSVKCKFYDIDDQLISEPILYPGDASYTLYGGHTYEILEDDTIVYEYKTGPYEGQALDKTFL
jgi:hypothetical protein